MKWIKHGLCLFSLVIMLTVIVQAQTIQNITYPQSLSKEYRSEKTISMAGNGTSVILTGDGKTGASITLQSSGAVTLNGGFTVQKGATLRVLSGGNEEAVTETAITSKTGKNEFMVYPNPAGNTVTIFLPAWDSKIKKELIVTDLSGRQVKQQPLQPGTTELDVAQWQRGNYIITISGSDHTQQTSKLVLQ